MVRLLQPFLQAIFNKGLRSIMFGADAMSVEKGIAIARDAVIESLYAQTTPQ